jgi:putative ABC transport system permease protein
VKNELIFRVSSWFFVDHKEAAMSLSKLWTIAYRDLGRNRRRSILTLLAVALGLALLMVMNGFIAGIMEDSLQNSIRLRTGHVQIRAGSYEEETLSLQAKDLLADPDTLAARASVSSRSGSKSA